jgi:hypothetical protein
MGKDAEGVEIMARPLGFVLVAIVLGTALVAVGCGEGHGSKAGGSSGADAAAGASNLAESEAGGDAQRDESVAGGPSGGSVREGGPSQGGQSGGSSGEARPAEGGQGTRLPEPGSGAPGDEAGGASSAAGQGVDNAHAGSAGAGGNASVLPPDDAGTSIVGLWEGSYRIDGSPDSGAVPLQAIIDPDRNVYLGVDHLRGRGLGTISATGELIVTVTGTAGSTVSYAGRIEGDGGSGTWSNSGDGTAGTWTVTRQDGVTVDPGTRAICDGPCWTNPDAATDPAAMVTCMFLHVAPSPAAKVLLDRLASCSNTADCDALFACVGAGSLADVYVSASGNDTHSGATPGQAKRTLNAAISVTQANGTVHIAEGSYAENVLISRPLTLQGGYDVAFTRVDPVASPTTIDGRGLDSAISVMLLTPSPARLALKALNVTNGAADGILGVSGGGLRIVTGAVEQVDLEDCVFSANRAVGSGGGLQVNDGTLTVNNCTFEGNTTDGNGGGLQVNDGTLTVIDCILEGNTANDNGGGAIDANRSTVTVTDTTVGSNQCSKYGGGIHVYECDAIIDGCTVSGNAAGLNGGGVYFSSGNAETYALADTTVTGNVPNQVGGEYADLGGNTLE